jgi:hypothetical protein
MLEALPEVIFTGVLARIYPPLSFDISTIMKMQGKEKEGMKKDEERRGEDRD